MSIRRAVDADRTAIAELHAASWLDSYRELLSEEFLGEIHQRLGAHWAQVEIGEQDLLLLAEEQGEAVGFLFARDGEPVFINTLHVRPGHRSGGVGAQLMATAARHFREQGRQGAYLDVLTTNARAIAFYQRLGGIPGGVKEKLVGGSMLPNLRIDFPDLATIIAAT
ncbi:GNAT family N-acetyltransferase [Aurantiacibacter sp. MUD11]|uniref:GNAT family N-acetyltransferase n=1 Tax=Aurantiacibacter sp. MUD11 TaxID=3003265 RepID=UPI0022AA266A|nr:GNAT family N-acetyltransferase [Aurantiacibacter sp. MUD11]WAT18214.1 GNAT family N-acetyltransferase [Aurantiacibacter sp. MUD11]